MVNLYAEVDKRLKQEKKKWGDIRYILVRIGDDWVGYTDKDVFIHCASYTSYKPGDRRKALIYGKGWFAEVL